MKQKLSGKAIRDYLMDRALIICLLVMIIVIICIEPSFLRWKVFSDILTQSAVKLIVALGLLFTLLLGGTDLSGGRQVGLAAVIVASLSQSASYLSRFYPNLPQLPQLVPILISLAVVAVIGLLNGLMVAKLKLAPFIATYGMSTIVYGINCLYYSMEPNNAQPIGGISEHLTSLAKIELLPGVKWMVIVALLLAFLVWFLLNKTVYGKNIYSVGGNPVAAKAAGINIALITVSCFIIESCLVGLGGVFEVARTGSATSAYGFSYEFDAISAAVVGGVSLSGGVGKVSGVILGVFIFTIISYGLTYISLNPNWQLVIKGLIIIAAVAMDMRKHAASN